MPCLFQGNYAGWETLACICIWQTIDKKHWTQNGMLKNDRNIQKQCTVWKKTRMVTWPFVLSASPATSCEANTSRLEMAEHVTDTVTGSAKTTIASAYYQDQANLQNWTSSYVAYETTDPSWTPLCTQTSNARPSKRWKITDSKFKSWSSVNDQTPRCNMIRNEQVVLRG